MTPTVAIDVRRATWRPEIGISRYSTLLVRTMAAIAESSVHLERLDLVGGTPEPGTTQRVVGSGHHFARRLYQEQVSMALRSRHVDLMHLPWHEGPVRASCPLVVNVHDLDTLEAGRYSWRFRAYYNTLLRRYVHTARRIIVPSEASLTALRARWPEAPYVHIPYGVDRKAFAVARDPAAAPTVLYTGGYGHRKEVPTLLQAFDDLHSRLPDVRLIVTGEPPADIARIIASLRAHQAIEVTGIVPLARLIELYSAAWVVAYPSALEGFGFPVLAAFAAGVPVVGAAGGSIPEIAGDAAILVPPGDQEALGEALHRVLTDDQIKERLEERGRARAADFDWDSTARRTLDVYLDVISEA